MDRGSIYQLFKSFDRYGKAISLTYNGKRTMSTFWGGVATLLTIIVCVSWWISLGVDSLKNPQRNFTVTSQTYLTTSTDAQPALYNINTNQF